MTLSNPTRFIRLKELVHIVGMSRASVYRMIQAQRFPASTRISTRAVGWNSDLVQQWIDQRQASQALH